MESFIDGDLVKKGAEMGGEGFESLMNSLGFTEAERMEIQWFFENIENFLFE